MADIIELQGRSKREPSVAPQTGPILFARSSFGPGENVPLVVGDVDSERFVRALAWCGGGWIHEEGQGISQGMLPRHEPLKELPETKAVIAQVEAETLVMKHMRTRCVERMREASAHRTRGPGRFDEEAAREKAWELFPEPDVEGRLAALGWHKIRLDPSHGGTVSLVEWNRRVSHVMVDGLQRIADRLGGRLELRDDQRPAQVPAKAAGLTADDLAAMPGFKSYDPVSRVVSFTDRYVTVTLPFDLAPSPSAYALRFADTARPKPQPALAAVPAPVAGPLDMASLAGLPPVEFIDRSVPAQSKASLPEPRPDAWVIPEVRVVPAPPLGVAKPVEKAAPENGPVLYARHTFGAGDFVVPVRTDASTETFARALAWCGAGWIHEDGTGVTAGTTKGIEPLMSYPGVADLFARKAVETQVMAAIVEYLTDEESHDWTLGEDPEDHYPTPGLALSSLGWHAVEATPDEGGTLRYAGRLSQAPQGVRDALSGIAAHLGARIHAYPESMAASRGPDAAWRADRESEPYDYAADNLPRSLFEGIPGFSHYDKERGILTFSDPAFSMSLRGEPVPQAEPEEDRGFRP